MVQQKDGSQRKRMNDTVQVRADEWELFSLSKAVSD